MDRGTWNVVHGTLFKGDFNTIGTKMYPRSRYGNKCTRVPGTGTWALYHVPGDYDSDCHVVHGSMLLLSIP